MSIETLVRAIQQGREKYGLGNPPGASEDAIVEADRLFDSEFEQPLPEAYRRLLRVSDGLMDNGLTIWPCAPHGRFNESVVSANRELRDNVSDAFLYFGQRDDSVFVLELLTGRFLAVELNGLAEWEAFADCEAMLVFMLERALD